jgi:hypothetical protein
MKKSLLIFFLLLSGVSSQSQVLITLLFGDKLNTPELEFGLEGGVMWSNISGMNSQKYLVNWNLGFYFDILLKKQWFLYTGVLVKSTSGLKDLTANDLSFLGSRIFNEEGTYAQKINYFIIPAVIKYKFKNRIYLELGPQFGLRTKAWVEFNSDVDGFESTIKESNKDDIKRLDVGILAGAGWRFSKRITAWSIGVKYYYGFVDVYKARSGTKNSMFDLKLSIPIGAGEIAQIKKEMKAEKKKIRNEEKAANKEAKENNKK